MGQIRRIRAFNISSFSLLQKMLGDDNKTYKVIREAALQNKS